MGKSLFSDDFKRHAAIQITERGYPVVEVADRLGIRKRSLYVGKTRFSRSARVTAEEQGVEICRLKRELAEVIAERNILKKATAYFASDSK